MMDINVEFLRGSINFLIKKNSGGTIKNETISNEKLAEELHKPIIGNFNERNIHSPFIGTTWGCRFSRYAIDEKIW